MSKYTRAELTAMARALVSRKHKNDPRYAECIRRVSVASKLSEHQTELIILGFAFGQFTGAPQ